jgi:hypothetical protein
VYVPGLACKHWTRLEWLARDRHSSLSLKLANYGRKKIYSNGPCCSASVSDEEKKVL